MTLMKQSSQRFGEASCKNACVSMTYRWLVQPELCWINCTARQCCYQGSHRSVASIPLHESMVPQAGRT